MAKRSRCCSPPEHLPTRRSAMPVMPARSSTSSTGLACTNRLAVYCAVSAHGEVLEQAAGLHHRGDESARDGLPWLHAEDFRRARGRPGQPQDDVDGGGLARAVGPEERDDLPRRDVQVDVPDRLDRAEVLAALRARRSRPAGFPRPAGAPVRLPCSLASWAHRGSGPAGPTVPCHPAPMTTVMVPRPGGTPAYREGSRRTLGRRARTGRGRGMSFEGWPEEALEFYEGLAADNSKAYWTEHKAVYEDKVLHPMTELVEELAAEFGEAKIFRPVPGRPVQRGQVPVQDAHRRHDRQGLHPAVRGGAGRRGRDVRDVAHPAGPLPPGGRRANGRPRAGAGDRRDRA